MTLPKTEATARAVVAQTFATALIAQPLPLVLPIGLPAPEPEVTDADL